MAVQTAQKAVLPGPKGAPLIGSIPEIQRKGIMPFYLDLWRHYGDTTQVNLGPINMYVFVRPEHIQHIMVQHPDIYIKGKSLDKLRLAIGDGILTLEGDKWYRQRKLQQPMYTPKAVHQFADIMSDAAHEVVRHWENVQPGQAVNVSEEMARTTIKVISRSMFGSDVSENMEQFTTALAVLLDYATANSISLIDIPLFIPTAQNQRLKAAKRTVHDFIHNIIRQRREQGLGEDLFSMLMSSRGADTNQLMTDDELQNEAMVTLFAGYETTANLLSWTWYLLSKHPEVEARLHEELDRVLSGRTPTIEDIPNLPYMKMLFDEVLRLYPPAPITGRDAAVTSEIDGYEIPKGSLVSVLGYATQRHPEFWEKPLDFYLEHFTEDRIAQRPRYAYIPFGAGQRTCIGVHFAQMEASLILAETAQRFKLRLAIPNDGAIRYVGVARPLRPIVMTIEKRSRQQ